MRIAIADDDPIVCQSLATILEATGTADVLWTANDGDATVRRYFETPSNRPDVLLVDVQMPGRDGLDAARAILAKDPAARILVLTTFADKAYIDRAMALGAKGYLIKQDVASVAPALNAVMAGQVVLGADVLGKLTAPAASTGSHEGVDEASAASSRGIASSAVEPDGAMDALLNDRERAIAALVAEGLDNRDIASRLFLSEGTVRNRVSAILDKLGLANRTQLAILWIREHR
ncbi:response regulator transcription factor [Bifidobacterium saguinibicoloris]|uniref:response regulator transcription factor n=1 Tax=Bifidobacterium saguinibicoloris TaxID=2834433 RepID=UPI001C59EC50|nr:response regulator transcription factor [Bifidobacterium saguinibicoloris]MBW3080038.1 response regulator transcription factor [Bifidobacterium saguinibicoloris]